MANSRILRFNSSLAEKQFTYQVIFAVCLGGVGALGG
jgi:hypothetical protein